MQTDNLILDKLTEITIKLAEQNLLQKTVLNFGEACKYLNLSKSHLYKLTITKRIPHFRPHGDTLYFRRVDLDYWLQEGRIENLSSKMKTTLTIIVTWIVNNWGNIFQVVLSSI